MGAGCIVLVDHGRRSGALYGYLVIAGLDVFGDWAGL